MYAYLSVYVSVCHILKHFWLPLEVFLKAKERNIQSPCMFPVQGTEALGNYHSIYQRIHENHDK